MSIAMGKLVEDSIINAISTKVLEKLQPELQAQWAAAVSEWAETRKTNITLSNHLAVLEGLIQEQTNEIGKLRQERDSLQQAAKDTLAILEIAKKELGIP